MAGNQSNLWRNIGIGIVIVLGIVFVMQSYARRGLQGRLRSATDDIGDQYSSRMTTQYEPYYLSTREAPSQSIASSSKGSSNAAAIANIPRKIIRNASINLQVRDVYQAQAAITAVIGKFNCTVVNSQINKTPDIAGTGTIIFKVLPKDLVAVMMELRLQGELRSESMNGEDVTEQYVDLQARLQNYKKVRDRLLKILEERAREVKDILEIERELARIGGDIDALEGRLTYLDRQVDMSTVTVTFFEKQVAVLRGMNVGDKFRETLHISAETFVNTFNGVIVFLSFLLPIVIWLAGLGGIFLLVRRFFWKRK